MTSTEEPIRPEELEGLFGPFAPAAQAPCALAVSGGGDSTALMVLFADWLRNTRRDPSRHAVITVDHGLRTGSAAEAQAVAAHATGLGFRHVILPWVGTKPQTGIQAAARQARYRLMCERMRADGMASLFTAHTRDDQAETLLMRLARGSGLDGLAAMAPAAPLGDQGPGQVEARQILRPLLGVAKARLLATLGSRGIGWIEDPTNQVFAFERSRVRAARAHLQALGLTDDMLALSAARLLRARSALEAMTGRFCDPASGNLIADPFGRIAIDRERLRAAGEEIALRVMARAVAAAGGTDQPVPLARLEAIVGILVRREQAVSGKWTLARAMIAADHRTVVVEREPGRVPLPRLSVAPGTSALWDGRFTVSVAADFAPSQIEVRPLGDAVLAQLRRDDPGAAAAPMPAAALAPSFWLDDALVAVPPLRHWTTAADRERLRAEFIGIAPRGRSLPRRECAGPPRSS